MSFPRRKDLFVAWSKAMVEGATVDKPNYSKNRRHKKPHRRVTRRRRKNNAKKD